MGNPDVFGEVDCFSDLFFLPRSISVPYAYQCCAFTSCDLVTSSSSELDVKKPAGGLKPGSVLTPEKLSGPPGPSSPLHFSPPFAFLPGGAEVERVSLVMHCSPSPGESRSRPGPLGHPPPSPR